MSEQWQITEYEPGTIEVTGPKEMHVAFFSDTPFGRAAAGRLIAAQAMQADNARLTREVEELRGQLHQATVVTASVERMANILLGRTP